jgi:hypothetical protein
MSWNSSNTLSRSSALLIFYEKNYSQLLKLVIKVYGGFVFNEVQYIQK